MPAWRMPSAPSMMFGLWSVYCIAVFAGNTARADDGPTTTTTTTTTTTSPMGASSSAAVTWDSAMERTSLAGSWEMHVSDDVDVNADGALEASVFKNTLEWHPSEVPGLWTVPAPEGRVWMRRVVEVPWMAGKSDDAVARWRRAAPVVAVMGAGNAFEVYVGGVRVGVFGDVGDEDRVDVLRPVVSAAIPASAVDADGRLELALRIWRSPALARMDPRYAGVSGVDDVFFGRADDVDAYVKSVVSVRERQEMFFGPLALVLMAAGLYHLQLFRRRRLRAFSAGPGRISPGTVRTRRIQLADDSRRSR